MTLNSAQPVIHCNKYALDMGIRMAHIIPNSYNATLTTNILASFYLSASGNSSSPACPSQNLLHPPHPAWIPWPAVSRVPVGPTCFHSSLGRPWWLPTLGNPYLSFLWLCSQIAECSWKHTSSLWCWSLQQPIPLRPCVSDCLPHYLHFKVGTLAPPG